MDIRNTLYILLAFGAIYGYIGLRSSIGNKNKLVFNLLFWGAIAMTVAGFYIAETSISFRRMNVNFWLNFLIGFALATTIGLFFYSLITIIQDAVRIVIFGLKKTFQAKGELEKVSLPGRRKAINTLATIAGGIPFLGIIHGITLGKYWFQVKRVPLEFPDLPPAFDGFTIAQISDIHAGSYDSKKQVLEGIQKLQDQNADIIVFTGDMVNSDKNEIDPYIDAFAALNAPYGMYSVMGNHDYYGFNRLPEPEQAPYRQAFESKHEKIGFELLNNQNKTIEKEGQKIKIAGVENWGKSRWFPKLGDLDKAFYGISEEDFTILLSHDPTHWEEKTLFHPKHVHLTLSGHTHGFQFGIKVPGFSWSPAQYRYKRWAGLYQEKDQYLYVNKGFGFLGFSGRVGMYPEITVFELRRKARQI